ncbi:ChbG/HpnK family deacetylase [Magnetospirillum molischianum]|uniref:YdjC-like protein n=1 Tax=Magnetospirillum molischianum DSM 120 TaxID=1150626 RepID=H8FPW6_MAGML|nr:ChbG/HpnK family deacetylase [Magnetospirillum molischianum]CCG40404.1 YdjC-like protein [Magnetospirillum molischianum DSM 120]
MTSPSLTLCADDYGLAPGIGRAIRALIEAGRLQATGCMTAGPFWPSEAALLRPLSRRAEFGVHLTLTDHSPLGTMPDLAPDGRFPPLGKLLKRAMLHRLDRAEIAAELERQVDSFEAAMGRAPDFLDGHHHVHQLPVVRDIVLDLAARRLAPGGWVRSCWDNPLAILGRGIDPARAGLIAALGIVLRRHLHRAGIAHNLRFRGVYDFSGRTPYSALFERFTDLPGPGTLVMCHPGEVDEPLRACETLTDQRKVEYAFLASDEMAASLTRRGLVLAPLPRA